MVLKILKELKNKYFIFGIAANVIVKILNKTIVDDGSLIMKIKVIISLILSILSLVSLGIFFISSFNTQINEDRNRNIAYFIMFGGFILSVIVLIILKVSGLAF